MLDWVQMNRGNLEAVCQRKGIVRIHRFHFDHDECSADAAFISGLQGDCGGEGFNICHRAEWGRVELVTAGVYNVWNLNHFFSINIIYNAWKCEDFMLLYGISL